MNLQIGDVVEFLDRDGPRMLVIAICDVECVTVRCQWFDAALHVQEYVFRADFLTVLRRTESQ